jgi:hypothetical protein
MNQIKSMVMLASMAAQEISLRNGAGSLSIIWVLVAGRVIVANPSAAVRNQYLTLLLPVSQRTHNCCAMKPK